MFQKKSLGQNFLRSEKALNQIVEAGDIQPEIDTIIEIGPGEGVLTRKILEKKIQKLIIIEKDDRLIPKLEEEFAGAILGGSLTLIHGDITEMPDLTELAGFAIPYKVIANIPYYITGLIIRQLFSQPILPERIVLLMQKEVVDRIVSHGTENEGKESLLSASIKLYGMPKKIGIVPKGAFVPAPNVDSAILAITDIQKPASKELETAYFELVKKAFSHKRKRLVKNIEGLFGKSAKDWEIILSKYKKGPGTRAEELSAEIYKSIAEEIVNKI